MSILVKVMLGLFFLLMGLMLLGLTTLTAMLLYYLVTSY